MVKIIKIFDYENYWEIHYLDPISEENRILIIPILAGFEICIG